MNKNRKGRLAPVILVALLLTGCGQGKVPDNVDVPTIAVDENGGVTSYLVESFDKEYYDITELTSMAISEAAEYNTGKQNGTEVPVIVEKIEELKDGSEKIVVTYKYDSTDTFSDFNHSILFYGTVQEAVDAGYDFDDSLVGVKDGNIISMEQILADTGKHVVITQEKVKIYCPEKVAYISQGAVYESDGSVDATQTEDTVVILMKK